MDLKQVVAEPLGDDDIRKFLPSSKILKYSDLSKYSSLDSLLTKPKDFAFVLYEDSPNQGHWTCISRPNEASAEFFDSYGGSPDSQQKWVPLPDRQKLGEGRPYLSRLLDNCPHEVVYNPVKYQKDGSGINDCGRHCVNRVGCMLKGMDLADYYKFMKRLRKKSGMDYDEIVSSLVQ
jgi:hypothetical protein